MFLWNWLAGILNYLGLYKKSGKLLLLGLDNAGKTTLLSVLKEGHMTQPVPTLHPMSELFQREERVPKWEQEWTQMASEELTMGDIKFTTFDLGGHSQARRVWRDYFPAVDAIVFIVDVCDRERFKESKAELDNLLNDEEIAGRPVLILGNKIDRPEAVSELEIRQVFGLDSVVTGKLIDNSIGPEKLDRRPVEIFMCSVLKRQGYGDGFRWLAQFIR